jgi:hypothetical protein
LKNVMTTVDAMKTANQTMKQQYKKVNLDKIEVCGRKFCFSEDFSCFHFSWRVIFFFVHLRGA